MKIAIYSRKSKFTGKGESIENQVFLCREYIKTHIPEAKDEEIFIYEDEGFSAKNLERPQFKLMMKSAKNQVFDYIVVYRLDRISRNVGDFAMLIEKLNEMHTAFVCIKEQFDTSTPMGRAMMNIAAVFAQLERETIAERVRDNLILLARTGRWLGGVTPLGFSGEKEEVQIEDGKTRSVFKLVPVHEELRIVKLVFEKFLEFRSMTKTVTWLIQHDEKTRRNMEFTCRAVKDILKNPVYCTCDLNAYNYFYELGCNVFFEKEEAKGNKGLMPFRRTIQSGSQQHRTTPDEWIISIGKHKGVISSEDWIKAQSLIGENAGKSFYRNVKNECSVFSGLVRCGNCGHVMRPRAHSNKRRNPDGSQTFSYMCEFKEQSRMAKCQICNVNGNVLDKLVCDEILKFSNPDSTVGKQLNSLIKQASENELNSHVQVENIQKAIDNKRQMAGNLMKALAKSTESDVLFEYTKQEIEKLDIEIKELQNELLKQHSIDEDNADRNSKIEQIEKSLETFSKSFDSMTVIEKRDFMHDIVDRIIWDGEKAHIFLYGAYGKT